MIRPISSWLLVALAGGALLAGCGSSSGNSTSSSQASSAAAPTVPAAAGTSSTSAAGTPGGAASVAGVQQAVTACKSVIRAAPTLSASTKAKVEGVCNKAASGDEAGARRAAKEVCVEVINASPVPAVAKQQALASCNAK